MVGLARWGALTVFTPIVFLLRAGLVLYVNYAILVSSGELGSVDLELSLAS